MNKSLYKSVLTLMLSTLREMRGPNLFLGSERDWVGEHVVSRPKKAYLNFPGLNIFFCQKCQCTNAG